MWSHTNDPFAESAFVRMCYDDFVGYVTAPGRLRQVIAELRKVGAVERVPFGYRLSKPPVAELDAIARSQLKSAMLVVTPQLDPPATPKTEAEREADAAERQLRVESKRDAKKRQRDALRRLDKQPSHVRDALAKIAKMPASNLRYSGAGSGAVQTAISWLADTGASWEEFAAVCRAAYHDASEDKPAELQWLFASKHAAYLQRIVTQVHAPTQGTATA